MNGIQEVSGSIPLISTTKQDTLFGKSPEVERFQDFFFTFKILTLGTDWNLTGTGFFCKKRLIECLHRFLLDRRLHMQIMLCHIQIRMTNHTLYQRNSFHVKGWPVSKSRPFT